MARSLRISPFRALALTVVLSLTGAGAAACADAHDQAGGFDSCESFSQYTPGDEAGSTVRIAAALTGTEGERFEQSLSLFETCTGIDVVHEGTDSLEENLRARAAGETDWDADLAVVPQPGLVADLADQGALSPLPDAVGANVELGWDHAWSAAGTVNGTFYAAPLMASVKSFVWYSPAAFDRAHYALPTTWDELVALTEEVVADHPDGSVTPWCLGVADGDTTGWPMTDWLEETILATGGTGAYDAWADHNVSLDDPSAVRALDTVGSLLLGKGRVPGGREGALSTTMEQAGQELVDGSCLMMMASSSFESMLPAGTVVTDAEGRGATVTASAAGDGVSGGGAVEAAGSDGATADGATGVSAFVLPSAEKEDGDAPVLVGGDYLVSLRGRTGTSAAASAVLDYLTSAGWAQERAELGGMATANRGVEVDEVSSDVAARATRILQSRQSVVRLDASDSMPSQVGTDALWNALSSWTAGEVGSRRALARAEAAWPADR